MVHSVGSAHDVALLGLAEDVAQVHAWDDSGLNGIGQHLTWAHRRQLIHIPCTSLMFTKSNQNKAYNDQHMECEAIGID